MSTTIFSWGYHGWGNLTAQLVQAVDAVEASRGFEPPLFVDIRIRRSVRAAGFNGPKFERLLGQSRYRWMKSLGNKFIETRSGPEIQIADPSAAEKLLALAVELSRQKQRLLFFCSCQWPRWNGEIACHRTTVAQFVLDIAKERGDAIEIIEWPGAEPRQLDLHVKPSTFHAVAKGRMSVPLGQSVNLAEVAGLPWCSIATLHSNNATLRRIVGPARPKAGEWVLPVLCRVVEAGGMAEYEMRAGELRTAWGLEAQSNSSRSHHSSMTV